MLDALLFIAFSATLQADGLFERAGQGMISCLNPDRERKTCESMMQINVLGGRYVSTETALLESRLTGSSWPVVVTIRSRGLIGSEGDRTCQLFRIADIASYTFTSRDVPLTAKERSDLVARLQAGLNFMDDKYVCSVFRGSGNNFSMELTMEGVRLPVAATPGLWVRWDEGYRVRDRH